MLLQNEQYENKESFLYFEYCCRLVAEKYGQALTDQWTNSDYVKLSGLLFRYTSVQISPSTLKRIFGKLKTTDRYYPQKATRDALAQYAGFTGWDDFVKKNTPTAPLPAEKPVVQQARVSSTISTAPGAPARKPIKKKWFLVLLLVPAVIIVTWILKYDAPQDYQGKAKLVCTNPVGGAQHSAIFKLTLPDDFNGDTSAFGIDFADGHEMRKMKPGSTLTHYYEAPGRYYATLSYKGKPCDTVPVYLTSNGWSATANIQHDSTRVYPVLISRPNSGSLEVTADELYRAGIDTNRTFFVDFAYVKPLDINGDNFDLALHVTTAQPRPGVRCSQVNLTLFGEKSVHAAIFIKPGCVNFAYLQLSERKLYGEAEDLSFLGTDLTGGGNVRLRVDQKKVGVFINSTRIFEGTYQQPLGKIYGIKITFAGIGRIHDLVLKDPATGKTFSGEFLKSADLSRK